MDDGAGQGPGDAGYALDLGDHELPEIIHVARFGPDDHVVGAGDVLGQGHPLDIADAASDLGGLAHLGLHQDVSLDHASSPGPHCLRPEGPRYPKSKDRSREGPITVSDLGEFGLIAALAARLPQAPGTLVGIGDDAAVLAAPDGRVVASTDILVENRHFRLDWSTAREIGGKAAAQNLADIAAMGAVPTALLVGLAAPGDLPVAWAEEMAAGLAEECSRVGATVAGGDLSGAPLIMLAVTALGDLAGQAPVTRSGARPGDLVAVAGVLGHSAAGLALLRAGLTEPAELLAAHRWPRPDYAAGPDAARRGATSMIDVSDGLLQDLGHLSEQSGVRIDVASAQLPVRNTLRAAADALGDPDPLDWVLAGGEDHGLVATFPPGTALTGRWSVIGQVREGQGVWVDSQRAERLSGWNHF
jgi:thiamine-monophosphate kinase